MLAGYLSRKSRTPWIGIDIPAVAIITLGLRVFNLLSLPIYLDEVTFLDWGIQIWEQHTRAALMLPVTADGRQPLFVWLVGGATYLAPDPLFAARMVSVLCGVTSVVGIYLVGYWLVGRRVGLLAGMLYALVPYSLFYDRIAMMDSLLNTAGIWSFALSVFIAARAPTARRSMLAGAGLGMALGVGLWTKMPALFMLAFPALCALLVSRRGKLGVSAAGFAVGATVFAALALLLFWMAGFWSLWNSAAYYSESPRFLLTAQLERWSANAQRYLSWLDAYLPAPLWWLVPVTTLWGLARRRRLSLLLLGCWGAFTLPIALVAKIQFESRYVFPAVFLLLLLVAILLTAIFDEVRKGVRVGTLGIAASGTLRQWVAALLFLAVAGPSLMFDLQLYRAPELAPLPPSDRAIFVTDWSSGYGFAEAARLVKQRAAQLTRNGQPVIVLGYYWWGHTYAGLKVYMRGMPRVFHYVDMHLARDAEGFMAAWRPHHVSILVVGNDSAGGELDRLDQFERGVPQAKRIGYFPKPGGKSSFRVYEIDAAAFNN